MTFSVSIYGLSSLVVASLGGFCALALVMIRSESYTRPLWLSGFLLGLCLSTLMAFLMEVDHFNHLLSYLLIGGVPYASGVCLYFYARQTGNPHWEKSDLIHLLPLVTGLLISWYWYQSTQQTDLPTIAGLSSTELWSHLLYVFNLLYIALTLIEVKRYHQRLKGQFSEVTRLRLSWLRLIAIGAASVLILDLLVGLVMNIHSSALQFAQFLFSMAMLALVFVTALFAIRQPAVFTREARREKYATSGVAHDTQVIWAERLQKTMDEEKPYLENELTLQQLAAAIHIKPHQLSQVLNSHLGQSFYDYVNRHRIEYASQLLQDPDQSVTEVIYNSGYNNKVSFYKAFKQYMGVTPSQYRQTQSQLAQQAG